MSRIAESAWGAQAIRSTTAILREQVYAEFIAAGEAGMTADEVAARLGRTVLACRPRCSELVAKGRIVPTGARRPNASGMSAAVWRVVL
jgi:hypothetical protein